MMSEQEQVAADRPTATLTTLRMTKDELGHRVVCVAGSLVECGADSLTTAPKSSSGGVFSTFTVPPGSYEWVVSVPDDRAGRRPTFLPNLVQPSTCAFLGMVGFAGRQRMVTDGVSLRCTSSQGRAKLVLKVAGLLGWHQGRCPLGCHAADAVWGAECRRCPTGPSSSWRVTPWR